MSINQNNITEESQPNKVYNFLPFILIFIGVVFFYAFKFDAWIKWAIFIISIIAGLGIFYFKSPIGISLHRYFKDSYVEIQKVVWPSRQETVRFTLIVFAFVAILGLFLWAVDSGLAWLLYGVILGKGS